MFPWNSLQKRAETALGGHFLQAGAEVLMTRHTELQLVRVLQR